MTTTEPTARKQVEDDWTTWSDPELMSRLLRRGVEAVQAKGWVRDRSQEDVVLEIEEVLDLKLEDEDGKPIRLETPLDRRPRR